MSIEEALNSQEANDLHRLLRQRTFDAIKSVLQLSCDGDHPAKTAFIASGAVYTSVELLIALVSVNSLSSEKVIRELILDVVNKAIEDGLRAAAEYKSEQQ